MPKTQAKTPSKSRSKPARPQYTVPSLSVADGAAVAARLQQRLDALGDLALTLKHVHWNVVGPNFIAVHEMIDPHVREVRAMVDQIAERIATLGVAPQGTPGGLVQRRSWNDYGVGRADVMTHLAALNAVYESVITDHRDAAAQTEETDPVTNDMLIGHLHALELFQWFLRAHLESSSGALVHSKNGGTD